MRKELTIAIILGITLGLIIAFGVWRTNRVMNQVDSQETTKPQPQTKTKDIKTDSSQLTILQPEENDVITDTSIVVSGIAKENTYLVISGEKNDYILKTSADGSFEQEVELIGGINDILIAYTENDNPLLTKTLRIIQSTEFGKEKTD